MPTCWSCEKVKGKRQCPARGGELICSKCCGTKRRVEIRCPPDCPYLEGEHDAKWRSVAKQKEEQRFLAPFFALSERPAGLLFFLHHVLLRTKTPLTDPELRDVLATARKTLETERKGIVYQHHTESPHLDPVAGWLTRVLAARSQIPGAPNATDDEVDAAVRMLERAVSEHEKYEEGEGGERYLDRARRILGRLMPDAPPLDLPEGLDEPPASSDLIVTS